MTEVAVQTLLWTRTLVVRDIRCRGTCRHASAEECATATELVFPYRGVYTRQVGRDLAVAEANQVLFFNAGEGYRIAHPVAGGDACLSFALDAGVLSELAPQPLLRRAPTLAFHDQRRRIDPQAQALAAQLRHGLAAGDLEPLQAESLALSLARRALGPRTSRAVGGTAGRRRLADRAKLVLSADPARRWTLAEIAAEVGGSPVYLTQVFQAVEGVPLYRHQLHLRLARALDLLPEADDLTALGLDLGFSSHSHFTAAFRRAYGRPPSALRRRRPVKAR
ncbi:MULTISPECIES: AraC family transcriptional regulator [unclassified Phenylobacterium]|uniref:helix-turn-helix transcriptional regulator n=1 Tax=unclassified Phenylobacterium TaxID=2640670 RepID=UPI00083ADE91|nr:MULTISPECIES: AraC family transcriptional regulator [unclassified Phenylobacterium]